MINQVWCRWFKMAAFFFPRVTLGKYPLLAGIALLVSFADSRAANVSLTASDATGASSFNSAGHWNNSAIPNAANNYFTTNFVLRSPADANAHTFGGSSLTIDA